MTKLLDALIIQQKIFKYNDGISKKSILNFSIDEEISLRGNRMVLFDATYHEGKQLHCGHCTS